MWSESPGAPRGGNGEAGGDHGLARLHVHLERALEKLSHVFPHFRGTLVPLARCGARTNAAAQRAQQQIAEMPHAVLRAAHTFGKCEQGFDVWCPRTDERLGAMGELDALFFRELKCQAERSLRETYQRCAIVRTRIGK